MFPASPSYQTSVALYWSNLAQLSPSCIFPAYQCQRYFHRCQDSGCDEWAHSLPLYSSGGGPYSLGRSSNIQNGVTIDLSRINKVEYNKQRSTTSIGPGTRWVDVYRVLDQLGVSVPGGRAGSVGVAGLTLGGEDTALSPY